MTDDLLKELPPVDEVELRWVLERELRPAQIASAKRLVYGSGVLFLVYGPKGLSRMEAGPLLTKVKFASLRKTIETVLVSSAPRIARAVMLSSRPLLACFRTAGDTFQLQPPPPEAPRPPYLISDHPFVLEFPVRWSQDGFVTNHRRQRGAIEYGLLLNAVLRSTIKATERSRAAHEWVMTLANDGAFASIWAQRTYWVPNFAPYADAFTAAGAPVELVPSSDYFARDVYKRNPRMTGDSLLLPDDLSDLIASFNRLSASNRRTFLRAAFWFSYASEAWDVSASSWFTSLISAIEALAPTPREHCPNPDCRALMGVTRNFKRFVELYAPGSDATARNTV